MSLTDVDLADAQAIRIRVRSRFQHASHEEATEVPVHVGHADVDHPLDLERRDREPARYLARRRIDSDVLTKPGERRAHQNCLSRRGSFRQSSLRSGMPCRSTAIRSSPQPKANPVYRSAS